MPIEPLPENASLENLRTEARRLCQAVRAGEPEALAAVAEHHPRARADVPFGLTDAQVVLARRFGFPTWPKLEHHLEAVEPFRWSPPEAPADARDGSAADTLVRLACLAYGDWHPSRAARALGMIAADPTLAGESVPAAAAVGDVAALRHLLAQDPARVRTKGGPHGWEPLLYACYSRLDEPAGRYSTFEAARVLLAAGADPNAGFLWCGNLPPFTALTGAFGEGEDGSNQPPHPRSLDLARLLLEAGADPNDGQTLYNRHFRANDDHLRLLFTFGLGQDRGGPWLRRFHDRMDSPARMLVEELWSAARRNFPERVQLLLDHGADVNARGQRDGRTPYEAAVRAGNLEIAETLVQRGGFRAETSPREAFAAACIAGRADEARALLHIDPSLLSTLGHPGRVELLHRAVESNRPEGVRLMAELGFELSERTTHDRVGMSLATTPMHNAAWAGHLELVRLLVELGADPGVREPSHRSTPLGWAAHNRQRHVVEYLMPFADVFDAVQNGGRARVAELLAADPGRIHALDPDGDPPIFSVHSDLEDAAAMLALLRSHGADLDARDAAGRTFLDRLRARGDETLAATVRALGGRTREELDPPRTPEGD